MYGTVICRETTTHSVVRQCPFCGELMVDDNRELLNSFPDFGILPFGCTKCIERPIEELNVPDGYVDFHNDVRAAKAFDEYRNAIAKAERAAGRL